MPNTVVGWLTPQDLTPSINFKDSHRDNLDCTTDCTSITSHIDTEGKQQYYTTLFDAGQPLLLGTP